MYFRLGLLLLFGVLACPPFDGAQHATDMNHLLELYKTWHASCLETTPCIPQKAFVFSGYAGLGDSLGGVLAMIREAVAFGRLFFLTEQFGGHDFRLGMEPKAGLWWPDYKDRICKENDDPENPIIVPLNGHIWVGHWIVKNKHLQLPLPKSFVWDRDHGVQLFHAFFAPSSRVQAIINPILAGWKSYDRVLGVAVRTGITDDRRFLEDGDHHRFTFCTLKLWEKYPNQKVMVFLTSDNEETAKHIRAVLQAKGIKVDYVDDSVAIVHRMVTQQDYKPTEMAIAKIYADYFLLMEVDEALLTQTSLFGWGAVGRCSPKRSP